MNDKAREAFEREYEAHLSPAEADWFRREEDDPEEYYHATTADAWWGFRAALQWAASQQAADGWRPIETAPKDGTDVLVMYMHIDTQIVHNAFYASESEGWDAQAVGWWSYDHSEVSRIKLDDWMTPTHWMPLPAALTAQGERDEQ